MRFRLRSKILLIAVGALLLAVGTSAFVSGRVFSQKYSAALKTNALIIGQNLVFQLDRLLKLRIPLEDLIGFDQQCRDVVDKYNYLEIEYAAVVDLQGKILFHSDAARQGQRMSDPESLRAIENRLETVVVTLSGGDKDCVAAIPVFDAQGKHIAAVILAFPIHVIGRETGKMLAYSIMGAGVSGALAIALLVFILSLWVTNPLVALTAVIREIREKGKLTKKVEIRSRDEIGDLASSFNSMTEEIRTSEEERERLLVEITEKNKELFAEIEERKKTQNELARHRDHLEELVRERTAELEQTQRNLLDAARQAGMAEIATDVLHNVGNVLNSVGVTTSALKDRVQRLRLDGLTRLAELIESRKDDLGTFVAEHEQGRKLPAFLTALSQYLGDERERMSDGLSELTSHVEHISEIVSVQQSYSGMGGVTERVTVDELIDSAVKINYAGLTRHGVRIKVEPSGLPPALLDRQRILQILINLINNAKYAVSAVEREDKEIVARVSRVVEGRIQIEVADNGTGIAEENLARVFSHGFTTKKHGHGFGLHSGANAATEMGGSLTAYSEGVGKGARFVLDLPFDSGGPQQ